MTPGTEVVGITIGEGAPRVVVGPAVDVGKGDGTLVVELANVEVGEPNRVVVVVCADVVVVVCSDVVGVVGGALEVVVVVSVVGVIVVVVSDPITSITAEEQLPDWQA